MKDPASGSMRPGAAIAKRRMRHEDIIASGPEAVRRIAANFSEQAVINDREGRFPHDFLQALRDEGLFGLTAPPANPGKPLAELPRQQEAVGGIQELLAVNLRLIRSVAAEVEAGLPPRGGEGNIVKDVTTVRTHNQ